MNKEDDKGLDDLFKKKLEDPVDPTAYNEGDWDALEHMLKGQKKRGGMVYWLPVLGGIAALLMLFLGYWVFFRPQVANHYPKNPQAATHHPNVHNGINGGAIRQKADHSQKIFTPAARIAANLTNGKHGGGNKPTFSSLSASDGSRPTTGYEQQVIAAGQSSRSGEVLAAAKPVPDFESNAPGALPIDAVNLSKKNMPGPAPEIKKNTIKVSNKPGYRPQFALSVLAAPDLNGVGSSLQQAKVGTNEGLLFSAGISKKFTISTGAIYSVKPYTTAFENYHTLFKFPVDPVNVAADCRMLDIPLNVGYQVFNKHQNQVSIGTGLSSYIMLHESYKFNYADGSYATGPVTYTVPNSNKYFFGVLNLNATFQHQVNPKVGFSVQPYMKLPLTNIGYSQVKLQTTGVAVGVTWNLSSLSKP